MKFRQNNIAHFTMAFVALALCAAPGSSLLADELKPPAASAGVPAATELSRLAASLKPRAWGKLEAKGLEGGKVWAVRNGSPMDYADKAIWDSVRRKLYYVGAAHGGKPVNAAFVVYDDASNTISRLPLSEEWGKFSITHSYNALAFHPESGSLYYRRFGKRYLTVYDTRKAAWRQELVDSAVFSNGNDTRSSLAWFKEMGGLVIYNNVTRRLHLYDPESSKVTQINGALEGKGQNFGCYNPIHKVVLFGGDHDLWKLTADGKIAKCRDAPLYFGVTATVNVVDPVTGDLLVFTGNRKLFSYDVLEDEWREADVGNMPFNFTGHGVTAACVTDYGVVAFLVSSNKPRPDKGQGIYIYKHAGAEERK
jgi:hypothetical protein